MKHTRNILGVAILASIMLVGMTAQAQDGAALFMSKACIACHGVEGKQPINDNTPKLAGQNKGYLMTQLQDIKSGARNNGQTAQMKPIVANLSDHDIEAIAEYLSLL
ncbi:c-type cytochrome [Candidatus Spongiihabitans sp.]|uniref:c-type cytochrome n=1 Tax=Candidatus Spongiihabitans sp. TaxID=3101308 RepID=UPI003C6F1A60